MDKQHWCRVVMNRAVVDIFDGLDVTTLDALEISGILWKNVPFRYYFSTSYPSYDVCQGVARGTTAGYPVEFDMILADQVLEHVYDPGAALKNIHTMLRVGGVAVVTTPFLIRLHAEPFDHWRWSETGLRLMLQRAGFTAERIRTAAWGNRACVIANLDEWVTYDPAVHSLENEPDYPCVVWAFAQKS